MLVCVNIFCFELLYRRKALPVYIFLVCIDMVRFQRNLYTILFDASIVVCSNC